MKYRIKQITLIDGKQIFYPSEEEVKKLDDCIVTVIVEEMMTKEEYQNYLYGLEMDKVVDDKMLWENHKII